MNASLGMRLLADLMGWEDDARVAEEFGWLQLMVDYKYDNYQGFSSGVRFFVSLLHWLAQFPDMKDRARAYEFVRRELIFVSQAEMHHLVQLSMPIFEREMRRRVAKYQGLNVFQTWGLETAERRVQLMKFRTLYVGLSDGARIDAFRRDNEGLVSNEQVIAAPEASDEKWLKLGAELKSRLEKEGFEDEPAQFERVCLIDDFSGSGSTLLRRNPASNEWDGKVPRFCKQNQNRIGKQLADGCVIHVHHYMASKKATETIEKALASYASEQSQYAFESTFSWILDGRIEIGNHSEASLVAMLRKCYDSAIENSILGKDLWFGYKQCGLPIVLHHNTPNNSIGLLWAASPKKSTNAHKMRALFFRRQRHVEYG